MDMRAQRKRGLIAMGRNLSVLDRAGEGYSEAPGARVAYFDNLKFLLIFLVVFGHMLTIVSGHSRAANALINFIYLFHMPAFVFVSGMLAKRYYSREQGLRVNRVVGFVLLYLIMYTGFWLIATWAHSSWAYNPFYTNSAAWYMGSMAWWLLFLPLVSELRPAVAIGGFAALSLLVGYYEEFGGFLVLSRTIVFAPFFYAGYFLPMKRFVSFSEHLHAGAVRVVAVGVLLLFLLVSYLMPELADSFHKIVVGYNDYASVCPNEVIAAVMRAAFYIVAVGCSLAAMSLVPRRRYWWTRLGERTLPVYVIHVWVLNISTLIFGVGALFAAMPGLSSIAVLALASFGLVCALAWRPLNDAMRRLLALNCRVSHMRGE